MNSGSSCLCVGKCAPGSKRTTCISHSPVTATSLTKTPWANVDGLHGKSAVLTDTAALGSSLVIKTPSGPRVIAKIEHSITKTALGQEIQLYPYVAGQDPPAAANHHRHDEQIILVDEPGPDRVCGEGRTTHRNIVRQLSLQVANRLRVEVPLETRLRCRDGLQRFGIDDLVGGLPDPCEVQRGRRPTWNDVWRLPNRHRLVHLASIEIHADGAHDIADESKFLLVGCRPIGVAGFISDIAIQRRRRSVGQIGHRAAFISFPRHAVASVPSPISANGKLDGRNASILTDMKVLAGSEFFDGITQLPGLLRRLTDKCLNQPADRCTDSRRWVS